MVSPKQLDFSSCGGVGDSDLGDATLSRRKSPRTPSSKRTAPEVPEVEETKKKRQRTDKKKKKKKKEETKTKLSSPSSSRIWNIEEEVTILKGLVDFKAKKGVQDKIDWEEFYRLLGGSIVEKFSKDQVYSKIRTLRRKYVVCMEKINQGNDPKFTRVSDLEAFGYSQMIWGQDEAPADKEILNELVEEHGAGTENETGQQAHQCDSGELKEHEEEAHDESLNENVAVAENVTASGEKILKEQEEEAGNGRLNSNEAVAENVTGSGEKNSKGQEEEASNGHLNGNEAVTESGTARQAHQIETGEEIMKQQDEEADVERLNENRAAKITETNDAKEGQDDNDELYVVQDAFETLMSHGLSDYQKKMQLEKLLNIGTDKMRELSNEWEALCDEERSLNLKKLRFSTKLAEAVFQ